MVEITILDFLDQAIRNKPIDGSDCTSLEAARKELSRLRRVTGKVVTVLRNAKNSVAPAPLPHQDTLQQKQAVTKRKKRVNRKAVTIDETFKKYQKVTVYKSLEDRALIKSSIKNNALFRDFLDSDLEDFIDVFAPKSCKGGCTVIQQGDVGDTFYVVQSGALDIFINMEEGGTRVEKRVGIPYRRGGAFGELALLYENPRAATIRASEDCDLWEITRTAFKALQLQIELKAHEMKLTQLESVKIGKKMLCEVMDLTQLESMAMATQYQCFEAGSIIVKEGEKGNTFYMVTKGHVNVYKESAGENKIAVLGVNSFFGEKALLSADTRQATCVAATNVECLTLTRDDFSVMLGNLGDVLSGRRASIVSRRSSIAPLYEKEETDVTLSLGDLKVKRALGEGAFGKVVLVKSKKDDKLFALKAQSKANILKIRAEEKIVTEYTVMRDLSHPFVVECYKAFQDKKYIYFLMGLLPGGEVMDLLTKHENFTEPCARFYCGIVVLVFDYLHQQKIAYRDLKPENLVLDEMGYCRVVDFGLAKSCHRGKTWTMCGTPDYMAPEIITGKGHDWGVDCWSLGILMYELVHGLPPFYDDDPANIAKKIMMKSFDLPTSFSRELVDLVAGLLTDQSKRLGRTKGGMKSIRKHPWFADFDWQELMNREMEVPWVPELGNLQKLGKKDDGKWDAPDCDWEPDLDARTDYIRNAVVAMKAAKNMKFRGSRHQEIKGNL